MSDIFNKFFKIRLRVMKIKRTGIGDICINLHQINCFHPAKYYYNEIPKYACLLYFNKDIPKIFKDKKYLKMTIKSNQNDKR